MDQFDYMDCLDEELGSAKLLSSGRGGATTLCTSSSPPPKRQRPPKSDNLIRISNAPVILNFENAINHVETHQQHVMINTKPLLIPDSAVSQVFQYNNNNNKGVVKKSAGVNKPTYDHIIAERKRREQLSQRFITLSGLVPGLKKMDKNSVLGDTIKYLKCLQEKVKTLEERKTNQTMESVVLVRKSDILMKGQDSSKVKSLPEIEARLCNKTILLKIQCEKRKGVLVQLLSQVEKLNLVVVNTNVSPFGSLSLYITIVAEMEQEFNSTVKNIVYELRSSLLPKNYIN
ncbi:hypothetical protein RD792_001192 [Penstemon davidsonii]|uniref:BHLH domain-containing protein n=1 Tax=Penstemon davidsonii TaxID=160366 RepID=A0ABR0DMR6_9LAMI|nr:hypothetical protein RD792_001192 [Penstemon davidsonii]